MIVPLVFLLIVAWLWQVRLGFSKICAHNCSQIQDRWCIWVSKINGVHLKLNNNFHGILKYAYLVSERRIIGPIQQSLKIPKVRLYWPYLTIFSNFEDDDRSNTGELNDVIWIISTCSAYVWRGGCWVTRVIWIQNYFVFNSCFCNQGF